MKVTLFVLLAGLCLVAVSAKVVDLSYSMAEYDFEYVSNDLADDVTDIDAYAVPWFGIFFVIYKALTTIKGVNCTLKEVMVIKAAAQNFVKDIDACDAEVSKQLQQLITTCDNIITTSNTIINLDQNVCGNSITAESTDDANTSKSKTPIGCFFKLLNKTLTLKSQVRKAIRLVKRVPAVPGDGGVCVKETVNNLGDVFNQFPPTVKACSRLHSRH